MHWPCHDKRFHGVDKTLFAMRYLENLRQFLSSEFVEFDDRDGEQELMGGLITVRRSVSGVDSARNGELPLWVLQFPLVKNLRMDVLQIRIFEKDVEFMASGAVLGEDGGAGRVDVDVFELDPEALPSVAALDELFNNDERLREEFREEAERDPGDWEPATQQQPEVYQESATGAGCRKVKWRNCMHIAVKEKRQQHKMCTHSSNWLTDTWLAMSYCAG